MSKKIIQCRIFQSTARVDIEEQINAWLEEMSKDDNFELISTDQETSSISGKAYGNITITIFYKSGGKKELLEKAEEKIKPKKEE